MNDFVSAFGLSITNEFPEVRGSWFKKWFVKSQDFLSSPEVQERLVKIERALELKHLSEPQATVDEKQAVAVSALLKAIENVPMVAMQVGSILLLKTPNDLGPMIQVKTLSQKEIVILENDQTLLTSPISLLANLSHRCATSEFDWSTNTIISSKSSSQVDKGLVIAQGDNKLKTSDRIQRDEEIW